MKPMAALNSLTPKTCLDTNINLLAEFVAKLAIGHFGGHFEFVAKIGFQPFWGST